MMNNNKWDGWLQISTTLAVLIGVALVVFELRQTSDLIELQILKQDADNIDGRILSVLPQNIYEIRQKSIDNPENLTQMEFRALDAYLWSITLNRWRSLYELSQRGLMEELVWQRAVREDGAVLAYPFGRAFWQEYKERRVVALPPDIVDAVDAMLADSPDNFQLDVFKSTLNRIESPK